MTFRVINIFNENPMRSQLRSTLILLRIRMSSDGENKSCALLFMGLLLISSLLMFPSYMKPEPPLVLLLLFSAIPIFIFVYFLILAVFKW